VDGGGEKFNDTNAIIVSGEGEEGEDLGAEVLVTQKRWRGEDEGDELEADGGEVEEEEEEDVE
jgi:hypothetical protein